MNKDSVIVKKEPSYCGLFAYYYCSEEKVKRYGGKDKVPLEVCGVYFGV